MYGTKFSPKFYLTRDLYVTSELRYEKAQLLNFRLKIEWVSKRERESTSAGHKGSPIILSGETRDRI